MTRHHLGTCIIPSTKRNVAHGRRWLLGRLAPLLGPQHSVCDDGVLLLSEALTNAIVHGTGDVVEVDVFLCAGTIRVEVIDGGGGAVPHDLDDPCGEHGRGIPMMRALSSSWGFEALDDGRLRVWFEIAHAPDPLHQTSLVPEQARYDGTREECPAPSSGTAHPGDG
ncbi:ATP-binding protein [Spirillospora albida]|uniref:ATP-binding protein n=1 Tax=Spirillospora albida TaxID=58123 RepID=UPI0006898F3B|nr:ATP-binding protein [Spirillospora albida]